ncbi:cupin domain-containing protein [Pseudonocardia nematodicida]|uniref:Cupin domain-containing protein n=1 Tax=Pseudonocardia nematodicida TaxID=1206997 RepID=A0ABV1K5K8_9PSEU
MDQQYERGWRRYSFDGAAMRAVRAHGAEVEIAVASAFDRGAGEMAMTLLELPPHDRGDAIGMHIHRDAPTGRDAEEVYIVVQGSCVMTFSTGEEVALAPGDAVTTYPGTGHAVRVLGEQPVRIVVVVPHAFRAEGAEFTGERLPGGFAPRIEVVRCHPTRMTPEHARCSGCGAEWVVEAGVALPTWAAEHPCDVIGSDPVPAPA